MLMSEWGETKAGEKHDNLLLEGPEQNIGEYTYNEITAESIQKPTLHTKGAAGPSGLDGDGWQTILTSKVYGHHSIDLCRSIARMSKKTLLQ